MNTENNTAKHNYANTSTGTIDHHHQWAEGGTNEDAMTSLQEQQQSHESTSSTKNDRSNDCSEEASPTEAAEKEVREARVATTADAVSRLEEYLTAMKEATKKMLGEMDVYLKTTEGVMVDYIRCQHSQHNEARRLEECEPGVAEATQRFLVSMQSDMMNGANVAACGNY